MEPDNLFKQIQGQVIIMLWMLKLDEMLYH